MPGKLTHWPLAATRPMPGMQIAIPTTVAPIIASRSRPAVALATRFALTLSSPISRSASAEARAHFRVPRCQARQRDDREVQVPDPGQHAVERRLVGDRPAQRGLAVRLVADRQAVEPGSPPLVQVPLDPDLVPLDHLASPQPFTRSLVPRPTAGSARRCSSPRT